MVYIGDKNEEEEYLGQVVKMICHMIQDNNDSHEINHINNIIDMRKTQGDFFGVMHQDQENIGCIEDLSQLISEYSNQNLIPTFFELYQQYQYHRRVKGDGNCFYRSFAFLYLLNHPLNNFQKLFPQAPIINCQKLPFQIASEQKAYELLSTLWNKFLKPLDGSNQIQRSKQLRIMFNKCRYADSFLIAYFRSLNHKYMTEHRSSLQAFVEEQFEDKSQKILKYSEEAQFLQILNLSNCLNIRFTIMMAHQAILKKIIINQHLNHNYLFFLRPGHYEILCTKQQFTNERQNLGVKSPSSKFLLLEQKFKGRKPSYDENKINNMDQIKNLMRETNLAQKPLYSLANQFSSFISQKSQAFKGKPMNKQTKGRESYHKKQSILSSKISKNDKKGEAKRSSVDRRSVVNGRQSSWRSQIEMTLIASLVAIIVLVSYNIDFS